jgi:hypothetical protein
LMEDDWVRGEFRQGLIGPEAHPRAQGPPMIGTFHLVDQLKTGDGIYTS